MPIKIIYEDNDVMVIEKEAGILVHPVKDEKDTLIDLIREKYPDAKLAHRLDKDTSGVMVIAKNENSYIWLKDQFKNRQVKKKYLALVYGIFKEKTGIIAKSIGRSQKRGGSQTVSPIGKMRDALTRYKIIKEFKKFSLIEAMPETGRTHQIRVHLASIGHPIAGDEKYKFKRQLCPRNLKRQFLHATYLKFQMPNGEIKEFYSGLPTDLEIVINSMV